MQSNNSYSDDSAINKANSLSPEEQQQMSLSQMFGSSVNNSFTPYDSKRRFKGKGGKQSSSIVEQSEVLTLKESLQKILNLEARLSDLTNKNNETLQNFMLLQKQMIEEQKLYIQLKFEHLSDIYFEDKRFALLPPKQ